MIQSTLFIYRTLKNKLSKVLHKAHTFKKNKPIYIDGEHINNERVKDKTEARQLSSWVKFQKVLRCHLSVCRVGAHYSMGRDIVYLLSLKMKLG